MHAEYTRRDEKKYFGDLNLLPKLMTKLYKSINIKLKISYDLYSNITLGILYCVSFIRSLQRD